MPTKIVISYNHIPKVAAKISPETDYIAGVLGEELLERITEQLLASKSGRMYGSHQASAPGEPPANWTGELFDSMSVKKTRKQVRLIIDADHAAHLEFGTVHMAPRPFIAPNIKWAQDRFVEMMNWLEGRIA